MPGINMEFLLHSKVYAENLDFYRNNEKITKDFEEAIVIFGDFRGTIDELNIASIYSHEFIFKSDELTKYYIKKNDIYNKYETHIKLLNNIKDSNEIITCVKSQYSINKFEKKSNYTYELTTDGPNILPNTLLYVDPNPVYGIAKYNILTNTNKYSGLRQYRKIFQIDTQSGFGGIYYIDEEDFKTCLATSSKITSKKEEIKNNADYYNYSKQYITTAATTMIYNKCTEENHGGSSNVGNLSDPIANISKNTIFDGYKMGGAPNVIVIVDIYGAGNDYREYTGKYIYAENCREANDEDLHENLSESALEEAVDFIQTQNDTATLITSINTDLNVKDVEDQSTSYMELFQNTTYTNKVQEAIKNINTKNINSIYGAPTQFLPLTDPRINIVQGNNENSIDINDITGIGRIYGEKILTQMPFLYIIPGVPEFMAGFSKEQRKSILASMIDNIENNAQIEDLVNNSGGRYYNIRFARADYVNYLNAMLHAAVALLQIDKETINGTELAVYDWSTPLNRYAVSITNNPDGNFFTNIAEAGAQFIEKITSGIISGASSIINGTLDSFKYLFTGEKTEAMESNIDVINENGSESSLAFFADCGNQTDDSFSNSTTQSQLLSQLNSLSDLGREISFITGIADANGTMVLNKLLDGGLYTLDKATDFANTAIGRGNLISNIISKARTILSGGRMLFPEIWADSSFSRSYSFRMKLISPSGDKLSVFLNILVPIYHLLALVLPRQSKGTPEGYYSPFLVKAACKSLLNIDMGIITDLNLTKGGEAEWTVDGLPTVAEISFTIKDLYEGLSMTELGGPIDGILSNASEIDYIANSCGVNIYEQYLRKNIELFKILYLSQFSSIDNLQNSIIAGINNAGVRLTDFINNRSRAIMRMLTPRNL